MPQEVLNEDWSDYDNRKIRDSRDGSKFACSENWEVDYLVQKIHKVHPYYTQLNIKTAINMACQVDKPPHPRQRFVERVMGFLENL